MKPTDDELEAMAVRVKALEWDDARWGNAYSKCGLYKAREDNGGDAYSLTWGRMVIRDDGGRAVWFDTLEAAKAAAQADYEARVLAALEPAPDQGEWDESCDIPETPVGNVGNYYGGLAIKRENGKPMWSIENWDGHDWTPCDPDVFAALQGLIKKGPDQ